MADHVRVLRKRLERMERAAKNNTGRPINQRDSALMEALREAIKVMSSPRFGPEGSYEWPEDFGKTKKGDGPGAVHAIYDRATGNYEFHTGTEKGYASGGVIEGGVENLPRILGDCGGPTLDDCKQKFDRVPARELKGKVVNVSVTINPKGATLSGLPPVDRDDDMGREYIPFGAGWEVHTKGKGSTFRLVHVNPNDPQDFDRYAVCDSYLHEPLTHMARDIRALIEKITAAPKGSGMAATAIATQLATALVADGWRNPGDLAQKNFFGPHAQKVLREFAEAYMQSHPQSEERVPRAADGDLTEIAVKGDVHTMTPEQQAVVRAWQDGAEIEMRPNDGFDADDAWELSNPFVYGFDFANFDYRVKP